MRLAYEHGVELSLRDAGFRTAVVGNTKPMSVDVPRGLCKNCDCFFQLGEPLLEGFEIPNRH
jgi:hypothetical protein